MYGWWSRNAGEPSSEATAWMDPREQELVRKWIEKVVRAKETHESGPTMQQEGRGDTHSSIQQVRPSAGVMLEYGSGGSTFYFSRFVKDYISIEHDLEFCSGIHEHAIAAGVATEEIEVLLVDRDEESGDLIVKAFDSNYPPPSNPHIHVYCIAKDKGQQLPLPKRSWIWKWVCCLTRCPSTISSYESYVRSGAWVGVLGSEVVREKIRNDGAVRLQGSNEWSAPVLAGKSDDELRTVREHTNPESVQHTFPEQRWWNRQSSMQQQGAAASLTATTTSSLPPTSVSVDFDLPTFDLVVDGRARPQCAWWVWHLLSGDTESSAAAVNAPPMSTGIVFMHDWNRRSAYHGATLDLYSIIDAQYESEQPGGGGLVVLQRKESSHGRLQQVPSWWLYDG